MDDIPFMTYGAFLAANFVTAISGGLFPPGEWYQQLKKPSWNPPNWLFPVVWLVLYIMIAVAGARVWVAAGVDALFEIMIYALQLILNFLWSAIFFGMRRMDLAFVEVSLLWGSIVWLIVLFHAIDALAAYLLIPYLIWVSIAALLNWSVWRLNVGERQNAA